MTRKAIKNPEDVKSGTYLRCVINGEGRFWTERTLVTKQPCKENTNIGREWMVGVKNGKDFFSDFRGYGYSRTFPFSEKLESKLSKAADALDFIFMLTGEKLTGKQQRDLLEDWEWNKTYMI